MTQPDTDELKAGGAEPLPRRAVTHDDESDERLGVAVLTDGSDAEAVIPALLSADALCRVEMAAGEDEDEARALAVRFHLPEYGPVPAALTHPKVSVVVDARRRLAPAARAAFGRSVLERGMHYCFDGALAPTAAETDELARLADDGGLRLASIADAVLADPLQTCLFLRDRGDLDPFTRATALQEAPEDIAVENLAVIALLPLILFLGPVREVTAMDAGAGLRLLARHAEGAVSTVQLDPLARHGRRGLVELVSDECTVRLPDPRWADERARLASTPGTFSPLGTIELPDGRGQGAVALVRALTGSAGAPVIGPSPIAHVAEVVDAARESVETGAAVPISVRDAALPHRARV